jgi:branched-chain amino acid transport system ATP-binding protein
MNQPDLLLCRGLRAGYGASQVLFGVDFGIRPGEVVSLLGRNGMGKSTAIKSILGVLALMEGEIQFAGQKIHGLSADAIARLGIAIVPEGRQCFPNLTVHEHLIAFARKARFEKSASSVWTPEKLYQLFPRLAQRKGNLGGELSGGEQQMLAIARALSTNPSLLILDEATEGLAPLVREQIWNCLQQLRREGQTTLIVDKYVDRLLRISDRHLIMERGKIAWQGSSTELSNDRNLWTRYLAL